MSAEADLYRGLIEEFVAATKHSGTGGQSPWPFVARFAKALEDGKALREQAAAKQREFGTPSFADDDELHDDLPPFV